MDEIGAYTGEITDFSKEGMSVESSDSWLPDIQRLVDRPLTFIFCLPPRNETLKVKGVIKRIEELSEKGTFTMGVNFVNLDDSTSKKISFFLWN